MPTNTGYISSSAINQVFTTGPYSGSFVTSSFSSGSTLNGPTLNYKQLFISGTVESLAPCVDLPIYSRVAYDPIACPPGGCAIPVLTSVTLSSSCDAVYDYKYNITYNSASSTALYTRIQYSTVADFSSNVATSSYITNSNPTIPPINISNLPSVPSSGYTTVYFRAFNSCSVGTTSSYSNILSASCVVPPSTGYSPFYFELVNNSKLSINLTYGTNTWTIANNTTFSSSFNSQSAVLGVYLIGAANTNPPTRIDNTIAIPGENRPQYHITASSNSNYSSLINTEIDPIWDSQNYPDDTTYLITTTIPANQTRSTPTISTYDLHSNLISNNLTTKPSTVFASDELNIYNELDIFIDRHEWYSTGKITFTINPYTTQYYVYDPGTSTCILSGTSITLADGSTTSVDNLIAGNRVLSPSILTLPFNNNFNIFNWAVNKLILTEGTAVVTGNRKYQVNEVYSINNGTLTTTSTHQHLFKQNGTWNIKPTPYLMVGDYLSDKNGEEILIESIEILTGEFTVFDLDVEENDLYVANDILTHNIKAL